MLYTTLNKIRQRSPCTEGWSKLLKYLDKTQADDEPLSFLTILESNGFKDAFWCCRSAPEYGKDWRVFAVWCARQMQHLMLDKRSIIALDVAERYANGLATSEELDTAYFDAKVAAAAVAASRVPTTPVWTTTAAWAAADAAGADGEAYAIWAGTGDDIKAQFIKVITGSN